jgi:hypothetical protein
MIYRTCKRPQAAQVPPQAKTTVTLPAAAKVQPTIETSHNAAAHSTQEAPPTCATSTARRNRQSPSAGVRIGEASNPGPGNCAQGAPGGTSRTSLRIATANVGGIAHKDGVRAAEVAQLALQGGYDVLLLQETNCIQQKANAGILGDDWCVYHDPTTQNTSTWALHRGKRPSAPRASTCTTGLPPTT